VGLEWLAGIAPPATGCVLIGALVAGFRGGSGCTAGFLVVIITCCKITLNISNCVYFSCISLTQTLDILLINTEIIAKFTAQV